MSAAGKRTNSTSVPSPSHKYCCSARMDIGSRLHHASENGVSHWVHRLAARFQESVDPSTMYLPIESRRERRPSWVPYMLSRLDTRSAETAALNRCSVSNSPLE